MTTKSKNPYFSRKEQIDFVKLCQIHGFKNRKMVRFTEDSMFEDDRTMGITEFVIYVPSITGGMEKKLSNVARYTNSRKKSEPCNMGKNKMAIKVTFSKR